MGGRDGAPGGGPPMSLKVKNTFIAPDPPEPPELEEDELASSSGPYLRQMSEPVHMTRMRQFSGPAAGPANREQLEGLDEGTEEPETEKEPCRLMQDGKPMRQESDTVFGSPAAFGRQETEMQWPSYGNAGQNEVPLPMTMQIPMTGASPSEEQLADMQPSQHAYTQLAAELRPLSGEGGWQNAMAVAAAEASATFDAGLANAAMAAMHGGEAGGLSGFGEVPPPEWADVHTVMMRNLPNKYTQHMLLEELNKAGFLGTFDFLYLPIDPETNANRGYAFINFIDPSAAWTLRLTYEGRKMSRFNSEKVVSVSPAALQGFEANYAHYSTARVSRGDPALRPLFLRESNMKHTLPKAATSGRRRGGRRSSGSLIDAAARQQQQQQQQAKVRHGSAAASDMQQGYPSSSSTFSNVMYVGLNNFGSGSQPADGPPAATAPRATGGSMVPKFCPFCGGKTQPEFKFCKFCGASVTGLG